MAKPQFQHHADKKLAISASVRYPSCFRLQAVVPPVPPQPHEDEAPADWEASEIQSNSKQSGAIILPRCSRGARIVAEGIEATICKSCSGVALPSSASFARSLKPTSSCLRSSHFGFQLSKKRLRTSGVSVQRAAHSAGRYTRLWRCVAKQHEQKHSGFARLSKTSTSHSLMQQTE